MEKKVYLDFLCKARLLLISSVVVSVAISMLCGCGSTVSKERPEPNSQSEPEFPFAGIKDKVEAFGDLDFAEFAEIGISVVPPTGFEKANQFHGFTSKSPQASITLTTSPVSFAGSTRPYLASLAKDRPTAVIQDRKVGLWDGCFLHFDHEQQGRKVGTQYLVFGNNKFSWIVSASYVDDDSGVRDTIAASLLSIRANESVDLNQIGGDTNFQLESSLFKKTPGWTKTLVFTPAGTFSQDAKEDPFVKAAEVFEVTPANRDGRFAFSRNHMLPAPGVKIDRVLYEKRVTVAEKDAIEIAAHAYDHSTKTPIILYFAVIFEEESQVLIHAWAGRKEKDKWLAEFEAIARSYKR